MLDHIGISVSDFDRSVAFYKAALAPLSLGLIMSVTREETGAGGRRFWRGGQAVLLDRRLQAAANRRARGLFGPVSWGGRGVLCSGDGRRGRRQRRAGSAAALPPQLLRRLRLDPDGNNIEAVCHRPE